MPDPTPIHVHHAPPPGAIPAPPPAPPRTAMKPGAYLQRRRIAEGMQVADVAARLSTEPRIAEHLRAEWIALIEAGEMEASFSTISALRCAFPFDLAVLERLALIDLGADLQPPRICRVCACSNYDPCVTDAGACSWAATDLCTACVGVANDMSSSSAGRTADAL